MSEEKYVYIECKECSGEGSVMTAHLYPNGHTEVWSPCECCYGEGTIEILESDYIVMKLDGTL